MVSAKLLQIFAVGPQDKKLYGNPQITFFKTVYQRHTNFGSNYICKDINNTNAGFGNIVRFKVQREGDLLAGIYIRAKLSITRVNQFSDNFNPIFAPIMRDDPQYTSFVNGIGAIFIEKISLTAGGKVLEEFEGEWIFLDNELYNQKNNKDAFYKSIYYNPDTFLIGNRSPSGFLRKGSNINDIDILIPVPFFFTKDTGLYLPVCAMNDETIEIELKIRSKEKLIIQRFRNNTSEPFLDSVNSIIITNTPNAGEKYDEDVNLNIDRCQKLYTNFITYLMQKKNFL